MTQCLGIHHYINGRMTVHWDTRGNKSAGWESDQSGLWLHDWKTDYCVFGGENVKPYMTSKTYAVMIRLYRDPLEYVPIVYTPRGIAVTSASQTDSDWVFWQLVQANKMSKSHITVHLWGESIGGRWSPLSNDISAAMSSSHQWPSDVRNTHAYWKFLYVIIILINAISAK